MISSVKKVPSPKHFLLDDVAFYGRTFDEYAEMFNFYTDDWRGKRVLDVAAGPASFVAEANRAGVRAVACDPLYSHSAGDLIARAESDISQVLVKPNMQRDLFEKAAWDDLTHYAAEKHRALFNFSRDYTQGRLDGRYIKGSLPNLPFESRSFDLVLSAHLLFVYATKDNGGVFESARFNLAFHINAIREMIRVSKKEVRIYPLKGPNRASNPLLSSVLADLACDEIKFELEDVSYKDIAGAHLMLRIRTPV